MQTIPDTPKSTHGNGKRLGLSGSDSERKARTNSLRCRNNRGTNLSVTSSAHPTVNRIGDEEAHGHIKL
jgi:hypothetical protein